ncbi:MAG: cobalamin biosynthesis protein CobD [Deltaproteobacteria bacterium]|nr:cobalamin biosynthesis protein CobD [Deltaproteobacteria bacterium]
MTMFFPNYIRLMPLILLSAYVLDLAIGDPVGLPHPIRWIGRLIAFLEKILRRPEDSRLKKRFCGALTAVAVAGIVFALSSALLYLSYMASRYVFFVVSVVMTWASISVKSLGSEAAGIAQTLDSSGLEKARQRLKAMVGRDTDALSCLEVLKAASESVAENTSDGIVAPVFYFLLGGPALMLAYKAINTLDSMLGYKNEKYCDFGSFAARADDFANYIPARLTALIMVISSFILGYDWRASLRIIRRDSANHPSPNSGLPEAAAAGALGVRFGGPMSYAGVLCQKPFIGDGSSVPTTKTLEASVRLMRLSAFIMVASAALLQNAAIFLL